MASIFSPIRSVMQGMVPSLTDTVSGTTFPSSPVINRTPQFPLINTTADVNSTQHVRSRSDVSRHSRQSSTVEIDMSEAENVPLTPTQQPENQGRAQDHMEFYGTITWVEKALPFILLLLSRIMWDHRLGILVFVGLFGTFFHVNDTIRRQVILKEKRLRTVLFGVLLFLFANIFIIYYVFNDHNLNYCTSKYYFVNPLSNFPHLFKNKCACEPVIARNFLILHKPNFTHMEVWTVFWCVGTTDYIVRFVTMALKCLVILVPRRIINFRKRGKHFLLIENISQFYRMVIPIPQWYFYFTDYGVGGEYFAVISTAVYFVLKLRMLFMKAKNIIAALKCFWKDTRYGRAPSKEVLKELGDSCPICQEEMTDPIELNMCKHIFCEDCIVMWFDRERTCPMCRAKIAEDPQWRDGSTQSFIQVF